MCEDRKQTAEAQYPDTQPSALHHTPAATETSGDDQADQAHAAAEHQGGLILGAVTIDEK